MAFRTIRELIDIVEGKSPQRGPWPITVSSIFADSLALHSKVFPDLADKLAKFVDVKKDNPLQARYGKHDGPLTVTLAGFWHCHLRDDAVLIYNLKNNAINLICIVSHAEMEGKRAHKTAKRIAPHR